MRTPRVTVVGAGSWGTTVASLAARNAPVPLWARRPELAEQISVKLLLSNDDVFAEGGSMITEYSPEEA